MDERALRVHSIQLKVREMVFNPEFIVQMTENALGHAVDEKDHALTREQLDQAKIAVQNCLQSHLKKPLDCCNVDASLILVELIVEILAMPTIAQADFVSALKSIFGPPEADPSMN